jgi:hypothetical protein
VEGEYRRPRSCRGRVSVLALGALAGMYALVGER